MTRTTNDRIVVSPFPCGLVAEYSVQGGASLPRRQAWRLPVLLSMSSVGRAATASALVRMAKAHRVCREADRLDGEERALMPVRWARPSKGCDARVWRV